MAPVSLFSSPVQEKKMIIDMHTHCFPDRIAAKAVAGLSTAAGGIEPHTDGTLGGLASFMHAQGVDRFAVLNIATNEHQMRAVNDFAAEMNERDDVIAFGSVYPRAKNALDELDRIKALGLKGVKFHFDYQGVAVDDELMRPIYRRIAELGLIIMIHAGFDFGFAPPYMAMPDMIARALRRVDSPFIASHWGGLSCAEGVLDKLCGLPQLYIDTSFGYGAIARPTAAKIIEKHGVDRMLFGSDCPWHSPAQELRLLGSLGLSESETSAICSGNAAALLSMITELKA